MYIGRRYRDRVNLFDLAVHPDMGLHTEVPLVTLARRAHLRVARFVLVLGGTRRTDNTGVHDGSAGNAQALYLQIRAHRLKQRLTQLILLQQVPEVEDRALVRYRLPSQIDTGKATHRAGLIQRFLRTWVRQVEPVLQEVDAQHPLQPHRWATVTRLGIIGLNQCTKLIPRNHLVHLGQKLLPARRLAVALKIPGGECLLSHRYLSVVNNARIIADVRT